MSSAAAEACQISTATEDAANNSIHLLAVQNQFLGELGQGFASGLSFGNVQARVVEGLDKPAFIKTYNAVARVEGADHQFRGDPGGDLRRTKPSRRRRLLAVSLYAIIAFMADPYANLGSDHRAHEYMGSWNSHVASWMSVPRRRAAVFFVTAVRASGKSG